MEYSKYFRTHQRILVVDDEEAIVESLAYALDIAGYDVTTAGNGVAALGLMRERSPQLVICDYMMPEMTGAQLTVAMRAERRLKDIPVILCTGAHLEQAEGRLDLFDVVLQKPYSMELLIGHVKRLMPSLIRAAGNRPDFFGEKGGNNDATASDASEEDHTD